MEKFLFMTERWLMNNELQPQLDQLEQDISSIDGKRFEKVADEIKQELESRFTRQIFDVHKRLSILHQKKSITGEQFRRNLRQLNDASSELPDMLTVDERFNQHALASDFLPYFINKKDYQDITKELLVYGKDTAYFKLSPDGKSAFVMKKGEDRKLELLPHDPYTLKDRETIYHYSKINHFNPFLLNDSNIMVVDDKEVGLFRKAPEGWRSDHIQSDELLGTPNPPYTRLLPNGLVAAGINSNESSFIILDPERDLHEKIVGLSREKDLQLGGLGFADSCVFIGYGDHMLDHDVPRRVMRYSQNDIGYFHEEEIAKIPDWSVVKLQAVSDREIYLGSSSLTQQEGLIQKLELTDSGVWEKSTIKYFNGHKLSDVVFLQDGSFFYTIDEWIPGGPSGFGGGTKVFRSGTDGEEPELISKDVLRGRCQSIQTIPDGKLIIHTYPDNVYVFDGKVADE